MTEYISVQNMIKETQLNLSQNILNNWDLNIIFEIVIQISLLATHTMKSITSKLTNQKGLIEETERERDDQLLKEKKKKGLHYTQHI